VHVGLYIPVLLIHLAGTLTAFERLPLAADTFRVPVTPFREGPAKVFSRHDVFPLNALRSLHILTRGEPLGCHNGLVLGELSATVDGLSVVVVDLMLE